jgi:hypothetical protein
MLAERDNTMSEARTNYMASLDEWSEEQIIAPLADAYTHGPEEVIVRARELAKRAIREKVLESYHNGQNAAPRGKQRPMRRF